MKSQDMDNQQIFTEKTLECNEYPVIYSDDVNADSYLNQFLNICNDLNPSLSSFLEPECEINDIEPEIIQEEKNKKDDKRMKSSFHNFQKHLVTTLRNQIDLTQTQFGAQTLGIEKKLWQCFTNSARPTRTLIYLITGEVDSDEEPKYSKLIKQYGIYKVLKNNSNFIVSDAQKNLREQILSQIEKQDMDHILSSRRMKNKQNFRQYFLTFVQQLRSGRFSRRVPKDKKLQVQNQ